MVMLFARHVRGSCELKSRPLPYSVVILQDGVRVDVGTFDLGAVVHRLFFIGTQLVALSPTGKIGVWNSMTQHWQSQA